MTPPVTPAPTVPAAPTKPSKLRALATQVRVWTRVHIIVPIKRSHWVFQVGDILHSLLLWKANIDRAVQYWAEQQVTVATITKDVDQRVTYYERRGPLLKAAGELRRHRATIARQAKNKQNGDGEPPRPKPTKVIDASGQVVDAAERAKESAQAAIELDRQAHQPPAEASTEFLEDEDEQP